MLDTLRAAWVTGEVTLAIAKRINATHGTTLTKNAVVGKVRLLKLTPRPSPLIAKNPDKPKRVYLPKVRLDAPAPVPVRRVRHIPEPPDGGTVGEAGCRFPMWADRAGREPLFCGQPRQSPGVWCRACRGVVFWTPMRRAA